MLVGRREPEWLDLITDLMQAPLDDLPVEPLALALTWSLDADGCAYSVVRDGTIGGEIFPRAASFGGRRRAIEEFAASGDAYRVHPLLLHYRAVGAVPLTQIADVPQSSVD